MHDCDTDFSRVAKIWPRLVVCSLCRVQSMQRLVTDEAFVWSRILSADRQIDYWLEFVMNNYLQMKILVSRNQCSSVGFSERRLDEHRAYEERYGFPVRREERVYNVQSAVERPTSSDNLPLS